MKSKNHRRSSQFVRNVRPFLLSLTTTMLMIPVLLGCPIPAGATTTINHQFNPAVINQGDPSLYTITITNDSTVPLSNARVTIPLDNTSSQPNSSGGRITVLTGTPLNNSCNFTGITAVPGTSSIVLSGGTIPAGSPSTPSICTFSLDVSSITPGTFHAFIPANTTPDAGTAGYEALENGIPVRNGTSADITLQVNALSPPTGAKSFSPSPAIAGDPITLTITLSNPNGGATMPLTTFNDVLPNDGSGHAMVVANPANASVNCTGTGAVNGTLTASPGSDTIALTGGTIGRSGACTISVRVIVPTVSGTSQGFSNSLGDGAIGNARGLTSPAFSTNLTVNTPIAVTKTFNPTTIPSGQPSLMTITVTNNSTTRALNITQFSDNLTGTTLKILTTASIPQSAPANPTVVCDGTGAVNGSLSFTADTLDTTLTLAGATAGPKSGANGKCVITTYVTSNVDGGHANSLPADAVQNPNNHHSPAVSASLSVNAQLTVNKTRSVASVAPGQWTRFTVTINNWSGAQVTNVSFRDDLPANAGQQMVLDGVNPVSSVGCSGGTWTGSDGAASVLWSGGTIPAGVGASPGVFTIVLQARLPVTATTGMTFSNQIPAWNGVGLGVGGTGNGPGGQVVNPEASPAANVTTVDAVALSKSFSPTSIAQGGTSTLTLTIRNRVVYGSLTSVNLTDNLPAGLTLAANPAATSNCGGSLQAFPGSGQVILTNGTVAQRPDGGQETTCAITVRVSGTALGTHTNTVQPANFSSSGGTIPGDVSATLTITTGLTGSKSFTPTSVTTGGVSRVKITVANTTNGDLTGVSIDDDDFATGTTGTLRIANPARAATSCPGSPTLVVNPGTARAQLLGATLNAGASCDFSFDVVTGGAGPWRNTIGIGKISSAEGPANTANVAANLSAAGAQININKSFNPVIVTGGVPATLTLTLTNPSGTTLRGIGFTDVFPTGIQVYAVPNVTSTCAGGTVTAIPGDGKVTLSGATLAGGNTCTITLQTTSIKFLNLTNSIPAGSLVSTEGYTNPSQVSATLSTLQGLGIMKAFSPAYVSPNAVTRLKMWLVSTFDSNAPTPLTLTGVSYTDNLPTGLVVAGIPNASTSCPGLGGVGQAAVTANPGGTLVTLSGAQIAPGTNCEIAVDVQAPGTTGTYTNIIPADAISTDQGPTNSNPAQAPLYVVNQPTITKAFSPATITVGGTSTLTVTVINGAGIPLTRVSLADMLPAGLAVAANPATATTCPLGIVTAASGSSTISLSGATVPAGGSCTFSAAVVANTPGSFPNNINAGQLTSGEGLTNTGPANHTLTVRTTPTVNKTFNPVSIAEGGTSRLTIALGNGNAGAITLSSALVDALPGNVFVAASPNIGGTCTNGSITAVPGAGSISYASGAAIASGGCTIQVDVTSSTAGVHTNIIAAGQLQTSAGANQDPAYADLAVGTGALVPPTVGKSFSPDTIPINGISTLTITLGNPNSSALTLSANFSDNLPANLIVATAPNIGGTCTNGSVTAVAGTGSITYASGAEIPAGGCNITVAVTSSNAGSYFNTIPTDALQTNSGNNRLPTVADLVVEAPIPPTVIKAFMANVINPGGLSRLTITLGNGNAYPIALTGDLIDSLPAPVTVAPVPNVGGTCTLGSVTAVAGTGTITYANGAVIPPGGCTIQIDVTAGVSGGPYTNTIAVGALQTDAGANTGPASANLFVNPPQPPSVSKSISPSLIPKQGTAVLTIALGNGNAAPLTLSSRFDDTLPANLVVATPNGLVTNCPGSITAAEGSGVVSYAAGAVIPAGGCTLAVRVTSGIAGTYINTIPAGALQTGAGANAVGTSASLQVVEWPTNADLSLTKTIESGTGSAGDLQTVTLKWRNTNAATPTGQMYQCSVSDPLPVGAFDPTTVIAGTTPSGYTFNRNDNTVSYTRNDTTAPCETTEQTATFTVRLKSDVITGSTYVNTATATAKTLPSNDPNVGAAATLTRNASDDVTVGAAVVTGKFLEATSENFTDPGDGNRNANPPVAIGEVLSFRLAFTLPVGLTKNVILSDLLPTGLRHIGTPTLDRTSTLTASTGNPGGINSNTPGNPVNVSLLGTSGEITLALGDVTNTAPGAQYILTLQAIVANVASNLAGTTLSNQGRIYYDNAAGSQQNQTVGPVTVHAVTPGLLIAKNANPLTGAGGDTITYSLTVENQSGANRAPAFELIITDSLTADHESPAIICPGPGCDAGVTGATLTAAFTGTTLTATVDRLDPGETVTFTYTARLKAAVTYGKSVVNTAVLTGTSLPGSNGTGAPGTPGTETGERTGEGGTNDIRSSSVSTVTINNPTTLTKTVLGLKSYYPIGDTATYRLTLPVPVGTTTNLVLTDTLPLNMAYTGGSLTVTLPAGAAAGNAPLADTNPVFFNLTGQTLMLSFGTLTVPTAGNIIVDLAVTLRNVLATQDGTTFTNSALLTFDNPAGGTITIGPATNNQVRAGEPNLELSKAVTAGAVGSDAGNTVSWRVVLQNTGHTTAFQVNWQDVLPDGLNRIDNVVVTPSGNVYLNGSTTLVGSADAQITSTANLNDTLALPPFQIEAGASLTITYDSRVMDTVVPGQVLNNVTDAAYTSLVGGGRDGSDGCDDDGGACLNNYNESASQSLTIAAPIAVNKTVTPSTYTIGQDLEYVIRVSLIEGTTPDLSLTDVLPAGLTYRGHSISVGNMGMVIGNPSYNNRLGTGQIVAFNLGSVTNPANGTTADDYLDVRLTARVDNIAANQDGTIRRNGEQAEGSELYVRYGVGPQQVVFDYDGGTPGNQGLPITLIEPVLEITKTANPATQSLGDLVTFTVQVRHTGVSTAPAYDLVINDTLPAGLTYVPGSATLPGGDVTVNGQNLQFGYASLTLAEGSKVFSYQARVDLTAPVGQTLTNPVALIWASLPGSTGSPDSGRTGNGGINDYSAAASAQVVVNAQAALDAVKTVSDLNGGFVLPGDTLEYTVVIRNSNVPLTGVIFTDPLPGQTTYLPGSVTSTKGNATLLGSQITVPIGDLATGETVTITFRVTINPGTPPFTVISNQGRVDSDQTVPRPTDADNNPLNGFQPTEVVVGSTPQDLNSLYATKTVRLLVDADGSGSVSVGDTMRYTVRLHNLGTATLTNVSFRDVIPAGLGYLNGSATITGGGSVTVTAPNLSAAVPVIPAGGLAILEFDVIVTVAGPFVNQGTTDSDQTEPRPTDSDSTEANGFQPTEFTAVDSGNPGTPDLAAEKTALNAEDLNGNGLVNPGEAVDYIVTVRNRGAATAGDVRLSDPLPTWTAPVPGSVTTTAGVVVSESPVTVNIGSIAPGETVTVRYRVRLDPGTPHGTFVTNTATITPGSLSPLQARASTLVVSAPTSVGSLCGSVYKDCDEDGLRDPLERGLSGVTVYLLHENGTWLASATTNFLGVYRFNSVPVGAYSVQAVVPAGYTPSGPETRPVTITEEQTSQASFALRVCDGCIKKVYLPLIVK